MMTILNTNWSLHQTGTEIAYLSKLTSGTFQATDRGQDPRNEIWNDSTGLIILSVYSSVCSNVEDYKTESKMHIDTEFTE